MGFTNSNYDDNHFNHSLIGCFDDINQGSFSGNNIPECIRQKGFDYNYDYNALNNKPTINGCILAGDLCFDDLGLPEVVAACTQAYAENCIFPYVDCCMDTMCECLCCTARDITENVECLHSATVACINETKTCLACDIGTVNTNLTLCINCVSCDLTSCINTVCTDLEDSMGAAFTCLSDDIADINSLIPTQASDINQLADKAFVNSTVGTNTSNYIKYNGGPFPSVECLEAYSGCLTNNDYAFVCGIDSCGNTYYDRYKYTITEITTEEYTADQGSWGCEYRLNNSSFTAAQFAAIDSGISANVLPSDMSSSNKLVSENALDDKLDNTTSPENAGKVVGVDEDGALTFVEGGGGGSALVPDITQAEYDELTPEEQNNGQIRHITDAEETPVPFAVVNDSKTTAANVWTAQKTNSEINTAKTQIMNRTSLDWENAVETVATNLNENTFTATEDGVLFWDLVGCNGNFAYIEINGVMITKSTALDSSYVSSTNGNVIISQGDIIKWKDGYNVNTTTALHKIIFVPYKNN